MILKITIIALFIGAIGRATYNDIRKEKHGQQSPLNWPQRKY